MITEKIQVKYLGESEIRFAAVDASFLGILKPGDTFEVSKNIYTLALENDPRYQLVNTKTKSKKSESEE